MSRSGSQLYENDRFLPSSLAEGKEPEPKPKSLLAGLSFVKEKAEPLLLVMSDPKYNFYKSLLLFKRVEIYANSYVPSPVLVHTTVLI